MLKLILISLLVLFPLQIREKEFYVKKVFVVSEQNSRYILTNFNQLVPSDRKISSEGVQCFVDKLKESGLFEEIATDLLPLSNKGEYELQITPTYKNNIGEFVVRNIEVDKSLGIDEQLILRELSAENITPGMSFQPYTKIEVGIIDAIEKIGERNGREWKDFQDLWIDVALTGSKDVSIKVTTKKPVCSE